MEAQKNVAPLRSSFLEGCLEGTGITVLSSGFFFLVSAAVNNSDYDPYITVAAVMSLLSFSHENTVNLLSKREDSPNFNGRSYAIGSAVFPTIAAGLALTL